MRQDTQHQSRRHSDWRGLIHDLNQRCRAEFDRAERLAAELADIRSSRAWRVLAWLRNVRRWFTSQDSCQRAAGIGPAVALASLPNKPVARVSIIIPFRNQPALLRQCLRGLRQSTHRCHEVILVDNGSTDERLVRLLHRLQAGKRYRVLAAPQPFNFARLCNQGAGVATGEFLVFLNNDIEVHSPDWLEQMLVVAHQREVGIVGATLLYPNLTIQHAGMQETEAGWEHVHRGAGLSEVPDLRQVRSVPAVTAACLLIRRSLFEELGGFDERYPVTHNDVDLCQRVRERGLLVAVTPHARLIHYESLSRGPQRERHA